MYYEFGAVLVFLLLGALFVVLGLWVGSLLRRHRPHEEKESVYECGEPTIGSSWIRYNSRFYNIALVYLLFDVEVVILIPALLAFRERAGQGSLGSGLVLAIFIFLALLAVGLAYEWFWGNLDWIKKPDEEAPSVS